MNNSFQVPLKMLGQSGVRLVLGKKIIYIDPYLSNSVQEIHDPSLARMVPILLKPEEVVDADYVFITHEHTDHCDPQTIPILAKCSPHAKFVCPRIASEILKGWEIDSSRIIIAHEEWIDLEFDLKFKAIPAAHPEIKRDSKGMLECVGYLLEGMGKNIYFAGDTTAKQEIIDILVNEHPIDVAFLPVNEHNFFKGRSGIIGNMSVREAFQFADELGVEQVVAVHWDMFSSNSVYPDEIRLVYEGMRPDFKLLINPSSLNFSTHRVSIIIRTLNEARYLEALLTQIRRQTLGRMGYEVILVDSGSTDETISIAAKHDCKILHITRQEFTFGRSLNLGCEAASGDILVLISGHCVPEDDLWLEKLCAPLINMQAEYCYGRQIGGPETHYSESQIFSKFYPNKSSIPQVGFFCNNANSALLTSSWREYGFSEDLTGLEDMDLARRIVDDGGFIAYVADAVVTHFHHESWLQVRRRFEREALALQNIMPQIHLNLLDTFRYMVSSIYLDWISSRHSDSKIVSLETIFKYRWNQYMGSWKGNHEHRELSRCEREKYFFPYPSKGK